MSEKRFTIVGEEYVGYTQGNAYIISNGECKFSLWESKEDAQKVCDYLNEQQELIEELQVSDNMGWKRAEHFEKKFGKELKQKKIYIKRLEYKVQKFKEMNSEQQATINKLQDLCGESDSENAKLRIENKKLKAQLREKEEDEQLYANEIVKLNKEAKEVLEFKSLGGDY